jgi:hypothetical protein
MLGRISIQQACASAAMGRLLKVDVLPPTRYGETPGEQNLTTMRERIAAQQTVFGGH